MDRNRLIVAGFESASLDLELLWSRSSESSEMNPVLEVLLLIQNNQVLVCKVRIMWRLKYSRIIGKPNFRLVRRMVPVPDRVDPMFLFHTEP